MSKDTSSNNGFSLADGRDTSAIVLTRGGSKVLGTSGASAVGVQFAHGDSESDVRRTSAIVLTRGSNVVSTSAVGVQFAHGDSDSKSESDVDHGCQDSDPVNFLNVEQLKRPASKPHRSDVGDGGQDFDPVNFFKPASKLHRDLVFGASARVSPACNGNEYTNSKCSNQVKVIDVDRLKESFSEPKSSKSRNKWPEMVKREELHGKIITSHPFLNDNNLKDKVIIRHCLLEMPFRAPHGKDMKA